MPVYPSIGQPLQSSVPLSQSQYGVGLGTSTPATYSSNPVQSAAQMASQLSSYVVQGTAQYINTTTPVVSNLQVYNPTASNPYQQGFGTSTPQTPVVNVSPVVSVNVPAPNVTVNIPNIGQDFINNVFKPMLAQFAPGAIPVIDTASNILNVIKPVLDPIIKPFTDNIGSMINNFNANFTQLTQQLQKIMTSVEIDASKNPIAYANIAQQATDQLLRMVQVQSSQAQQSYTQAFQEIGKSNQLLGDIAGRLFDEANRQRQAEDSAKQQQKDSTEQDFWSTLTKFFSTASNFLDKPGDRTQQWLRSQEQNTTAQIDASIRGQLDKLTGILNKLQSGKYAGWHEVIEDFTKMGGQGGLLQGLINFAMLLTFPLRVILSGSEPIANEIRHLSFADHPTNLLDADSYIEYLLREPSQNKWAIEQLGKLGLSEEQIQVIRENRVTLPDEKSIITANLRNIINNNVRDSLLKQHGYDNVGIEIIDKLAQFLPTPQDLIVMSVHDVFDEQSRRLQRLDEDFPEAFKEYAAMQGISEQWARNYWASHWQYPSINQVFEMLQRSKSHPALADVDLKFVNEFLRIADYSPYYRDKLLAISYTPLNRVDIRRIYKAGQMSDEELHRRHLELGVTDEDASKLDEFVKKTNLPEDETDITKIHDRIESVIENRYLAGALETQDVIDYLRSLGRNDEYISKYIPLLGILQHVSGLEALAKTTKESVIASIISARKRGNISKNSARSMLLDLGLSQSQADLSIFDADLQYTINLKTKAQDVIQRQYAIHNIDETEFANQLAQYDFTSGEISKALDEARLMRLDKTKKLTETQLDKMFKSGAIDEATLREELAGLNYSARYIDLIVKNDLIGQGAKTNG